MSYTIILVDSVIVYKYIPISIIVSIYILMVKIAVTICSTLYNTLVHYNAVLNGLEMVTFKGIHKNAKNDEEVSHIKTPYVDFLMGFLKFNLITESGEELCGYNISLNEIDMYGEGSTIKSAKKNLINTVCEYVSIYINQIDLWQGWVHI